MGDARKRVAMVSYSFYRNDDRIRRHVSNLVADGYEVDLISLRYTDQKSDFTKDHIRLFFPRGRRYGANGQLRVLWEYLAFARQCLTLLLRNHLFHKRYCLLHVNNMPNFLIFAGLPLRLLGVPLLLDIHDAMPEIYQDRFSGRLRSLITGCLYLEERICMRLARYVITTEHTKWQRLLANGLSKKKSDVVMNAADPGVWKPPVIADEEMDQTKEFRLVFHGTLAPRLGVDVAIRAVKTIARSIPHVRLDIVGDGEQRAELVALTEDLGLTKWVSFSDGFVSVDKLPDIVCRAHLAVLPYRNTIAVKYGMPTKLLECVRLGVPCVCVDIPTVVHYFNERQVRFFPSEDSEALAAQVIRLYEHPEEREELVREAAKFLDQHNFVTERDRYLGIVHKLVGR